MRSKRKKKGSVKNEERHEMNGRSKAPKSEAMDQITVISSDNVRFVMNMDGLKQHSEYFRGLLDSGMQESLNRTVHLPTLPSESLRYVDDFLNKGEISVDDEDYDSLSCIANAASYLLVADLMKNITDIVISWLNIDTYADVDEFVKQFVLLDAREQMKDWVLKNASDFIRSRSFFELSYDDVRDILCSDKLLVHDEAEVAEAGIRWMDRHEEEHAEELCEARASLMDYASLGRCLKLLRPKRHKKLLQAVNEYTNAFKSPAAFYKAHLGCQNRCEDSYVITVGGFTSPKHGSRQIQIASVDELTGDSAMDVKFRACKEKLPKTLCEHCVCVLNNDLYVIGGQTRYCSDGKRTTNEVHRFNTSVCKWQKLHSMREARSLFFSGAVRNRIYAVSGWIKPQTVTRTVEEYNPETDTWRYVHRLDRGVHEHAGSILNGKIYISGGYKGPMNGHLNDLKMFDPETTDHDLGEWIDLSPMQVCRSYHVMVPVGDKALLVAGGVKYSFLSNCLEDLQQCEYYDVALNQWTLLENPIPYVGSCMGHLLHNNKLMLFGGHCFGEDVEEKTHDKLQILDLDTLEWTVASYTSNRVNLFPAETVKLPQNFAMRFKTIDKVTKSG